MNDAQSHATPKAAIIAIGTEITAGEIINTNAHRIASKLTDYGFNCDLHVSVPDQRDLMHWAIERALTGHALIIVTGGLGPTTDDFTRDVIAASTTTRLVWNEESWLRIVHRLQSVGAPIAESNKQQAFFPEGATIYPNNHGTAAAFSVRMGKSLIIALPGPPQEIEGIWQDHIKDVILNMAPKDRNQKPLRWRCLGLSESKLGEIVEESLTGSYFLTGYRSHMPYIDVKVWVSQNRIAEFESKWRPQLEGAISKWLVGRDNDDAANIFRKSCPLATPIYILDRATHGYLSKRIYDAPIEPGCQLTVLTTDYATPMPPLPNGCLVASVSVNLDSGAWQLSLTGGGPHQSFSEQSRYRGAAHAERLRAYIGEKTLLTLNEWLKNI